MINTVEEKRSAIPGFPLYPPCRAAGSSDHPHYAGRRAHHRHAQHMAELAVYDVQVCLKQVAEKL